MYRQDRDRLSRTLLGALALAAALGLLTCLPAYADEDEIPFDVAEVFFELNDTDGDLGIHALIDGGPWKQIEIEAPDERIMMQIRLRNRLRRQGLTELFFESAEPTFDVLAPRVFFRRFPEGTYEVEGLSLDNEELESETEVTHLIPAPAGNLTINGQAVPEDCDEGPVPSVSEPLTLQWDPVLLSHPELGRTNEPIEVVNYQVAIEREEPPLQLTFDLGPDVTSVELPFGVTSPGDEIKVEILAREASFNQTGVESCFEIE